MERTVDLNDEVEDLKKDYQNILKEKGLDEDKFDAEGKKKQIEEYKEQ